MAIENKRMQQRGGAYSQFNKSDTLPKEFQLVTSGDPNASDGRAVYVTFDSGDPKRLATYEDMKNDLNLALDEIKEAFVESMGNIYQKTYTTLSSLGLQSPCTILQILNAMETKSKTIIFVASTNEVSDIPSSFGVLEIYKNMIAWQSRITYSETAYTDLGAEGNPAFYVGYINQSDTLIWKKMLAEE